MTRRRTTGSAPPAPDLSERAVARLKKKPTPPPPMGDPETWRSAEDWGTTNGNFPHDPYAAVEPPPPDECIGGLPFGY